jgi:hypothetical protein
LDGEIALALRDLETAGLVRRVWRARYELTNAGSAALPYAETVLR